MSGSTSARGQPLLVLASILGAWLVARVLFWNPLFPHAIMSPLETMPAGRAPEAEPIAGAERFLDQVEHIASAGGGAFAFPIGLGGPPSAIPGAAVALRSLASVPPYAGREEYSPWRRAAGHQMLLAAAFGQGDRPTPAAQLASGAREPMSPSATSGAALGGDRPLLGASPNRGDVRHARLSGDSWVLWREGSADAGPQGDPTYGRSQAGAVLRYRLFPAHARVPEVYARATRTLEGSRQTEVAAGLSLRPLARIPLTVAAEARVTETASGREVRPAAFAVVQLPPAALPLALRGEAYVQGGYVGGKFATAFIDGQARVDGRLAQMPQEGELRLGFAAWGGAQKGASRLDVGPSAALAFKIGEARARISVDYRMRAAGGAAPASGPAVTFSAGF